MAELTPQTPEPSASKRRWIIRVAGSTILLGGLFWLLPLDKVGDALRSIPPGVFILVLGLFLAGHVAAALKWWLLLDRGVSPLLALKAHFAGLAANLCLPGAIGGDAVRAGIAQATMKDGPRVVAAGTADRLIDMIALLTITVLGLVLSARGDMDSGLVVQAALVIAASLVGVIALPRFLPILWRVFPALPGRSFAERLAIAFAALGRKPATLAITFAASVAIQTLFVSLAWWLAVAANAEVTIGHWMFAWPLAKIIAILPVSLNGLGLREATLAALLTPFGANAAVIVAAGLMWQAILFAAGGIGALVLALSGLTHKTQKRPLKEENT